MLISLLGQLWFIPENITHWISELAVPIMISIFISHQMFHFLPHCLIKTKRNANWKTAKTCLYFASRLTFTYKPTHWSYSVFRGILCMKSTASAVAQFSRVWLLQSLFSWLRSVQTDHEPDPVQSLNAECQVDEVPAESSHQNTPTEPHFLSQRQRRTPESGGAGP